MTSSSVDLTDRQLDVEELIVDQALSDKDIAANLGISKETVAQHVSAIYKKYGVNSRLQLAVTVWRNREKAKPFDLDVQSILDLRASVLQPKDFQVCSLLVDGLRYKDIGNKLDIKPTSIAIYIWRVRQKLGFKNKKELLAWFKKEYPTEKSRRLGYVQACVTFVETFSKGKQTTIANKAIREWLHIRPVQVITAVRYLPANAKPEDTLTTREFKVCELLSNGKSIEEIALAVNLQPISLRRVTNSIHCKTSTRNKLDLVVWFNKKFPTDDAIKSGYRFAWGFEKEANERKQNRSKIINSLGKS